MIALQSLPGVTARHLLYRAYIGKYPRFYPGVNTGSSLIPSELNAFNWVGHDLRPIGKTDSFQFGRCPPGFFSTALDANFRARSISRD